MVQIPLPAVIVPTQKTTAKEVLECIKDNVMFLNELDGSLGTTDENRTRLDTFESILEVINAYTQKQPQRLKKWGE